MVPSLRILIRPRPLGEGDSSEHSVGTPFSSCVRCSTLTATTLCHLSLPVQSGRHPLCSSLPSFSMQIYKRVEVRWEKQEAAGGQVTHCSQSHCTQQGVLGEGVVRGQCSVCILSGARRCAWAQLPAQRAWSLPVLGSSFYKEE